MLIPKNRAICCWFSKMKQLFLSEFSRTPSKKCDYFTKSGASVSRAAHDPGGGLDSETSGARLWGSMAITPGSLVTTTTGGSQDTWFRATKTFKTSTPLFWMAYPADTKQWKTTTLSNLPQVWFSGRAWIPGDPTLFFFNVTTMFKWKLSGMLQHVSVLWIQADLWHLTFQNHHIFKWNFSAGRLDPRRGRPGSSATFKVWTVKFLKFTKNQINVGRCLDGSAMDLVRSSNFEI